MTHAELTAAVAGSLQMEEQRDHRHDAPAPKPKPCPHCVNGIVTDLNGAQWKCSFCGGVPTPRIVPGTTRSV